MSIPDDILLSGETVIHESKLHWVGLIKEILYSLAYIALFVLFVMTFNFSTGWIMWPVTIVWLGLIATGLVGWFSTEFAVTNRRVLFRKGVLSKKGYEIPIDQIQDVGFQQSALQRLFGSGDLVLKTSASTGRTAIRNIPDPVKVKTIIGEAREAKIDGRFDRSAPAAPAAAAGLAGLSAAEQLKVLGDLYDQGKLSQAEFEAEKRRVIGGG